MDRVKIKTKAKEVIKGRIWEFWKGYLVYGLIIGTIAAFLEIITGASKATECLYSMKLAGETLCYATKGDLIVEIISLVVSFITAFLALGFVHYTMKFARKKSLELNDIFKYKKAFVPTFLLLFLVALFTSLWSLLFIIPGIIAELAYSMSQYIYCDKELKPMECIKASKEMMDGHKWDYFVFNLSFVGWIILGAFTFGLLYIWLIPYISTADVLYYDELKKIRK